MIKTRHTELRAEMVRHGYDGSRLSQAIGITNVTLSSRLCGKSPWTSKEMYMIMDLLELDYSLLHKYFPKNGIQDQNCYRKNGNDLPTKNDRIKVV